MKKLLIILGLALSVFLLNACHESEVGFLLTKDAVYDPDTIVIRLTPDPEIDASRIKNRAPWVSLKMQGYAGTNPITFSVESVNSDQGEEAAAIFMKELSPRGGGVLMYPFENNARPGRYTVSVRLTNEGYSQVVDKALTFIVLE